MIKLLCSDIDGCLTSQQKILIDDGDKVKVAKLFSDKDSSIIERIKDQIHIVLVSGDSRINEKWAKSKEIDFILTPPGKDKLQYLYDYLEEKNMTNVEFAYLGNDLPDLNCIKYAKCGFYPNDMSCMLYHNAKKLYKDQEEFFKYILNARGGEGCFEEMVFRLIASGELNIRL